LVPDDDDNVAANSATSNEENGVNLASPVVITSGTGVPVVQKSDANVATTSDRVDVLSNVSAAPPTDAEAVAVPEVHAVNDATFSSTLMEDGMTAKVFYGKRRPTASERTSKRLRRIPKRLQ
jgi:hypothetical protein